MGGKSRSVDSVRLRQPAGNMYNPLPSFLLVLSSLGDSSKALDSSTRRVRQKAISRVLSERKSRNLLKVEFTCRKTRLWYLHFGYWRSSSTASVNSRTVLRPPR